MKAAPPLRIPAVILTFLALAVQNGRTEVRTFTSISGTTIRGELVSVKGEMVTIKKEDGQTISVKGSAFSRMDIAYLETKGLQSDKPTKAFVQPAVATKGKPYVNSLGMAFVPVPDTKVLFCTTVTRKEDFSAFIADSGKKELLPGAWEPGYDKAVEGLPVGNISWIAANEFCKWLSQREGLVYRMPTDREWSIAVGLDKLEDEGATPHELNHKVDVYPWGTQWPPPRGAGNYADEALDKHNRKGAPVPGECIAGYDDGFWGYSPVTAFKPNRLGLHDMGGNVWQWCEDWYDTNKTRHALRGAAWFSGDDSQPHSTARWPNVPSFSNSGTGFRCVIELP